jgi:hypothetical protein
MRRAVAIAIAGACVLGAAFPLGACGGKVAGGTSPSPTATATGHPHPPPPDTDFPPDPPPPPNDQCPTSDPIDAATLPYEPPSAVQIGACTDKELDALNSAVTNASSDDDLKRVVSSKCAACVFTDANGSTWGPLPEMDTGSGAQAVTIDVGGCYEVVTGSRACGKAVQNRVDCRFSACAGCADDATYSDCIANVDMAACKDEYATVSSTCGAVDPSVLTKADAECGAGMGYDFDGAVRVMCITGP